MLNHAEARSNFKTSKSDLRQAKSLGIILLDDADLLLNSFNKPSIDLFRQVCNEFKAYNGLRVLITNESEDCCEKILGKNFAKAKVKQLPEHMAGYLNFIASKFLLNCYTIVFSKENWQELERDYSELIKSKQSFNLSSDEVMAFFLESWTYKKPVKIKRGYAYELKMEDYLRGLSEKKRGFN